jgi:hypothetical protein
MGVMRSCQELSSFAKSDPLCVALADVARASGACVALVGGVVRDWLLGRDALDWDLVVSGDSETFARAWSRRHGGGWVTLDAGFGVVRLRLDGGLTLDVSRMQGDSLASDLSRRDVTLNAIACSLEDGGIHDPLNGLRDLGAGVVRAVSRNNLASDPARLLRVYRFAAVLDFAIADSTRVWVRELADQLDTVAGERLWTELCKLVSGTGACRVLKDLQLDGLLEPLLMQPQDACRAGLALHASLIKCLARDSRTADWLSGDVGGACSRSAVLRVVALLGGAGGASPGIARFAARMRLSRRECRLLLGLAGGLRENWPDALNEPVAAYRMVRRMNEACVGVGLLALACGMAEGERLITECLRWERAPLPRVVTGDVLRRVFSLAPGPLVGRLLALVEAGQVEGVVVDETTALAYLRAHRGEWGVTVG